jgi:hypothetical protein
LLTNVNNNFEKGNTWLCELCYKAVSQADNAIADFQSAANFSDDAAMKKQAMDEIKGLR